LRARREIFLSEGGLAMTARQVLCLAVLLPFLAYTAWVLATEGYLGFWAQALGSPVAVQLTLDLVIALSLVLLWMWEDARATRMPFAPYLVVTLLIGSIGPLAYLIHREARMRRRASATTQVAV
jgi:hypothetical protein